MFGWHILNYYMVKMVDSYFFQLKHTQTLRIKARIVVRLGFKFWMYVFILKNDLKLQFGM